MKSGIMFEGMLLIVQNICQKEQYNHRRRKHQMIKGYFVWQKEASHERISGV